MLGVAPLDFPQEPATFPRQSQPCWHEGFWPAPAKNSPALVVTEYYFLPSQVKGNRIAFRKTDLIHALFASFKKHGSAVFPQPYELRICGMRRAARRTLFANTVEKFRV